jgi:hypothetical protein
MFPLFFAVPENKIFFLPCKHANIFPSQANLCQGVGHLNLMFHSINIRFVAFTTTDNLMIQKNITLPVSGTKIPSIISCTV